MSEFKCPKCGAKPHEHGKGETELCSGRIRGELCEGLICECDFFEADTDGKDDHGESESNPCEEANCYHCGWGGRMPPMSDTKDWPPWAKTALKEGWKPPGGWQPKGEAK